ncbi:hypothetical protein PENTCL1PPCAC_23547, partial [Pristionchus entomophagus]
YPSIGSSFGSGSSATGSRTSIGSSLYFHGNELVQYPDENDPHWNDRENLVQAPPDAVFNASTTPPHRRRLNAYPHQNADSGPLPPLRPVYQMEPPMADPPPQPVHQIQSNSPRPVQRAFSPHAPHERLPPRPPRREDRPARGPRSGQRPHDGILSPNGSQRSNRSSRSKRSRKSKRISLNKYSKKGSKKDLAKSKKIKVAIKLKSLRTIVNAMKDENDEVAVVMTVPESAIQE